MSDIPWIEWNGGECPVHPDMFVDVKDRDGFVWNEMRACFHDWQHGTDFPNEEPVAYRILSPSPEPVTPPKQGS